MKHYIFEDREWVETGRIAKKPVFSPVNKTKQTSEEVLIELRPLSLSTTDNSCNIWQDQKNLFEVHE